MIAHEPTDIRDVVPLETYREHVELLAAELAETTNERDALREALAAIEPAVRYTSDGKVVECPFCHAAQPHEDWYSEVTFPHTPDCQWMKARALLAGQEVSGE
jgi:hypothetical protein